VCVVPVRLQQCVSQCPQWCVCAGWEVVCVGKVCGTVAGVWWGVAWGCPRVVVRVRQCSSVGGVCACVAVCAVVEG